MNFYIHLIEFINANVKSNSNTFTIVYTFVY